MIFIEYPQSKFEWFKSCKLAIEREQFEFIAGKYYKYGDHHSLMRIKQGKITRGIIKQRKITRGTIKQGKITRG